MGLGVTVLFLWLLLRQVELAKIGAAISSISLWSLLIALTFLAAGYTVRIARWWWMLRVFDPKMPLSACSWPFLVSISLNNLLPFRAGDAIRVIGFYKELHFPAMRLLGTLVLERLLDLMTLLVIFYFGLLGVADGTIPTTLIRLVMWIIAAAVVAVITILFFSKCIEMFVHWVAEHSYLKEHGWSDHIKRHSGNFLEALGLLRTPRLTLQFIAFSALVWGFEGAVFATVAHALNIMPAASPWFALATGTLGTLLPSSPGYVGTFDYLASLGLVAYGVGTDMAAAFAVITHIVLWLPLTLIGMSYFLRPGARLLLRKASGGLSPQEERR